MKPYKINSQWIDLDHVLAIDDEPTFNGASNHVYGHIELAFRTEPLRVYLGELKIRWEYSELMNCGALKKMEGYEESVIAIKRAWEDFKTAWMNRDKT